MTAGHASLATRYSPNAHNPSRHAIPDAELRSSRSVTAPTTTQEEFGNEIYQSPANAMEVREHVRHTTDNLNWDVNAKAFLKFVSPL